MFLDVDSFGGVDYLGPVQDVLQRAGITSFVVQADNPVQCVRTGKMAPLDKHEVKHLIRTAIQIAKEDDARRL